MRRPRQGVAATFAVVDGHMAMVPLDPPDPRAKAAIVGDHPIPCSVCGRTTGGLILRNVTGGVGEGDRAAKRRSKRALVEYVHPGCRR